MRYLFRAWTARNPKRGLHFLKCYLQLLWPNQWTYDQMWQLKTAVYPNALSKRSDLGSDPHATHFLTSRIAITLTASDISAAQIIQVLGPLRSTLGARG